LPGDLCAYEECCQEGAVSLWKGVARRDLCS